MFNPANVSPARTGAGHLAGGLSGGGKRDISRKPARIIGGNAAILHNAGEHPMPSHATYLRTFESVTPLFFDNFILYSIFVPYVITYEFAHGSDRTLEFIV